MRIFVLGDPHFKKNNTHIFEQICSEILSIVEEKKPDLCICLGDTLDTHDRIYLRAQSMATRFFINIAEKCPLVILIGNHDRENNSDFMSNIHPFVGLECHKNIKIVYESIRENRNGFDIIYVPYVPPGKFYDALEHVDYYPSQYKKYPDIIFCHQEFKGCNMGTITSTKGDIWSTDFPVVISGHIHEYQILPNILYVGTFLQQNYGENENKAVMMMHLEDIKDPTKETFHNIQFERITLKTSPKRKTIHLTFDSLPDFNKVIPPDNINKERPQYGGTYTRAILHMDIAEAKSLKSNPYYKSLENTVDKVDIRTEGNKISVAGQIVKQIKEENTEIEQQYSLENIVKALLKDDLSALKIFEDEILNIP